MMARGFKIEVASLDAPDASWVADFPVRLHALGPVRLGYGYSPRFIPWLRAHYREYDVVVVNGIWQFHSFATRRALRGTGTPYCVYTHGMLDPWFKKRYPLKHLKKWLYWPWGEYPVLRDAARVFFTTEEERLLSRQSFRLYRCNESVISFGTSSPGGEPGQQRALFLENFPELKGKRILLFLGRIHEKKGGDLLVEAFRRLLSEMPDASRDWQLVMAGPADNEFALALKSTAERIGLAGRITWTGMLGGDLKWGAFHAAEVFALPSHQENFGVAVAEALACGVPVLLSNRVNIWREVETAGAGLIESDDAHGAFRLLQRWLELSEPDREIMRRKAVDCFKQHFEIEAAVTNLGNALSEVVEG